MKYIISTLLLILSLNASKIYNATVLETMNSAGYSYMKVKEGSKTYWIAMVQRDIKIGDNIAFIHEAQMSQFHSKTLNRTFESILFASDPQEEQRKESKENTLNTNNMQSLYDVTGTITIADLVSNRDSYITKEITIKGVVTKVSLNIMKKSWVHIDDGSSFKNINSIIFTTKGLAPDVGDIVYAKGRVEKDVDFGFGYFYPIIVQNATFKQ